MAGRPSARLVAAMLLLLANEDKPDADKLSAYACAKRGKIALSTLYRSRWYGKWLIAKSEPNQAKRKELLHLIRIELARREVDFTVPLVHVVKKPQEETPGATKKQH